MCKRERQIYIGNLGFYENSKLVDLTPGTQVKSVESCYWIVFSIFYKFVFVGFVFDCVIQSLYVDSSTQYPQMLLVKLSLWFFLVKTSKGTTIFYVDVTELCSRTTTLCSDIIVTLSNIICGNKLHSAVTTLHNATQYGASYINIKAREHF